MRENYLCSADAMPFCPPRAKEVRHVPSGEMMLKVIATADSEACVSQETLCTTGSSGAVLEEAARHRAGGHTARNGMREENNERG